MKKSIITIILTAVISFNLFANDISREEWRNMSSKERKEYKDKMLSEGKANMLQILSSQAWVLEAHTLQDRTGESYILNPTINFVGVAGENSTIQLGDDGEIGFNGVGGITLDGKVQKHEINEGKKANSPISVKLHISGNSSGFVTMMVTVSADGNASAMVTDIQGNRLTYKGQIKALGESTVFKGSTNYL